MPTSLPDPISQLNHTQGRSAGRWIFALGEPCIENGAFWPGCLPRRAVFTQVPAALPTKTTLALSNHPIQPSQCKKSAQMYFLQATARAKIWLKQKMAVGLSGLAALGVPLDVVY